MSIPWEGEIENWQKHLEIKKQRRYYVDEDDYEDYEDEEEKREFIRQMELSTIYFKLPDSLIPHFVRYEEHPDIASAPEETFEGKVCFFINDLFSDPEILPVDKKNFIKKILNKITDTIEKLEKNIQKSKDKPQHLKESFIFLKEVYINVYNHVFKDFKSQIAPSVYKFREKYIDIELLKPYSVFNYTSAKPKKRQKEIKIPHHFKLTNKNKYDKNRFQRIREELVNGDLLSKKTKSITLEKSFTSGIESKIDWTGGKGKLFYFFKLLKERKIIEDANYKKIIQEIFLVDGEKIISNNMPKAKEAKSYIKDLERIINKVFITPKQD